MHLTSMNGVPAIALILWCAGVFNVEAASSSLRSQSKLKLKASTDSSHRHKSKSVRKVVELLQNLRNVVNAEEEEQKKIYDRKICDCQQAGVEIVHDIEVYEDRIPVDLGDINGSNGALDENNGDLNDARRRLGQDQTDLHNAENQHNIDMTHFQEGVLELKKNIKAIHWAINYISKGLGRNFTHMPLHGESFLQAAGKENIVDRLQQITVNSNKLSASDRDLFTSFLTSDSGSEDVGTEEVLGILKQMYYEFMDDLRKLIGDAETEAWHYNTFVRIKKGDEDNMNGIIRDRTGKKGELMYRLANAQDDLGDHRRGLSDAEIAFRKLKKECMETKTAYREAYLARQEELKAIYDAIQMLNNDDAMELFRSRGVQSAFLFLQLKESTKTGVHSAVHMVKAAHGQKGELREAALDGIFAGVQREDYESFTKVIGMIDRLIHSLQQDHVTDQYAYDTCKADLDENEELQGNLTKRLEQLELDIEERKKFYDDMVADIEAARDKIKYWEGLIESRNETLQKQREAMEKEVMENNKALHILEVVTNRLKKVYHPEEYDQELGDTTRPDLFSAAQQPSYNYQPEPEARAESRKVFQTLELVVLDLRRMNKNQMDAFGASEKEFLGFVDDANKFIEDLNTEITEKGDKKVQAEADRLLFIEEQSDKKAELERVEQTLVTLRASCAFIMEYFEQRKTMRNNEIEGLENAKMTLEAHGVPASNETNATNATDATGDEEAASQTEADFVQVEHQVRALRGAA